MTFGEARQRWRDDVLVDEGTAWFSDADGLSLLKDAAAQIADGLRLLRAEATIAVADAALSLTPPADMLAVQPLALTVGTVGLVPEGLATVRGKQGLPASRYPRYYHYDPGAAGSAIEFAPPIKGAASARLRYYQRYDTAALVDGDAIWGGAYAAFHHLVVLLAGVTTFQGLELYQRAAYFAQRYNEELQKFAAVLGATNVANLMVPPEQRGDPGRVSA